MPSEYDPLSDHVLTQVIQHDDPKLRNKEVTWDEFQDYYRNVSCSIDNDEYFQLIIKNAWNLDNRTYGKGWAG